MEEIIWKNTLVFSDLRVPSFTMQWLFGVIGRRTSIPDRTIVAAFHILRSPEERLDEVSFLLLFEKSLKLVDFLLLTFHKRNKTFFSFPQATSQGHDHFLNKNVYLLMNIAFLLLKLVCQQPYSLLNVSKLLHQKRFIWWVAIGDNAGGLGLFIFLYNWLDYDIFAFYFPFLSLDNLLQFHYLTALPKNHLPQLTHPPLNLLTKKLLYFLQFQPIRIRLTYLPKRGWNLPRRGVLG